MNGPIKVPDVLLNGTPVDNVASILRHGLLPGKGESGASFTRERGAIFFTDSMSAACDYSSGGDAREPMAVIVVRTKGLSIERDVDDAHFLDGTDNLPAACMPAGEPEDEDTDIPKEIDDEGGRKLYWHHSFMCRCTVGRERIKGVFLDKRAKEDLGVKFPTVYTDKVQLLGCDGYPTKVMHYYSIQALRALRVMGLKPFELSRPQR